MQRTGTEILTVRALNRALLARQLLLERVDRGVLETVEHLVGLQAQNTSPPYVALWARLRDPGRDALSAALHARKVVRLALMRSTIHLVTARDCLALRPVLAAALERNFYTGTPYGRRLAGMDLAAVAAAGRAAVEEAPRTIDELGKLLGRRWPKRDAKSLGYAVRALVPLVQVPPRGAWGEGGLPRCTSAEAWLGAPLARATAPDAMLLRYLRAFGPAGAADAATWSGLAAPALAEALERLRPKLRAFRDERGRALFDLADAPRPGPDAPSPVRFLPEYDNVLLSHAERTRVVSDEDRRRVYADNGVRGTVLVDGFVRATWAWSAKRAGKAGRNKGGKKGGKKGENETAQALLVSPFRALSKAERAAVEAEGAAMIAFTAGGDGEAGEVKIVRAQRAGLRPLPQA